jgi:bifunctional ADP-heptose synthase (sugar kinase/adenylyltransferase)
VSCLEGAGIRGCQVLSVGLNIPVDPNMTHQRFDEITGRYPLLRLALAGDFCLDRYFDIDPTKAERSIETGLVVHNIVRVRCQPGAAGTILNNLVALGVGEVRVIGCCGQDGEGYELKRALSSMPGVCLEGLVEAPDRRTFTYTKPLILRPGLPPEELNRLDLKNWSPTPAEVRNQLARHVERASEDTHGLILMDQVDLAETGVVTRELLEEVRQALLRHPNWLVLGDSRRGLRGWPPISFKMNAAELNAMSGEQTNTGVECQRAVERVAASNGRAAFVTLAERGIVGAAPGAPSVSVPSLPIRGPIDIVGAGDSVTANLMAALAAGATLTEAMELAMVAASLVIHQLGTTGTASVAQIRGMLF